MNTIEYFSRSTISHRNAIKVILLLCVAFATYLTAGDANAKIVCGTVSVGKIIKPAMECYSFIETDSSGDLPPESGGGGFSGNRGDRTDVQDASKGDPCTTSGNPIVLYSGNKVEPETDFESGGEMPLTLTRTYNHYWTLAGLFGKYWTSSFDYSLVWQDSDSKIFAQRPDGRRIKFIRVGTTNRWNEDKYQPVAYIEKNVDGTYTHYSELTPVERYDGTGRPLEIKNLQGTGWTFSYVNNYLDRITHTSGRYVQFTWTSG